MNESISVIVPTYNMSSFLPVLWDGLVRCGVADAATEVLFVNDGSTDETVNVIRELQESGALGSKIRLVDLPQNIGRFRARLEGARQAVAERLLFLDSRLELPTGFGEALSRVAAQHESIVGSVDIDTSRNVFCLYWERSHRFIFRRHYKAAELPITLTPANYDEYLKGTTVFLCTRRLFLDTCAEFSLTDLLSDDTLLMRRMVESTPIVISPDVRVGWVPREDARGFLTRLWERGPSFVEYHVFERRGAFFYAVLGGLAALGGSLTLLVLQPPAGLAVLGAGLGAVVLSTAAFARSPLEFMRLAPLHTGVVLVFGAGIVRGIAVNAARALRRRHPRSA